MSGKFFILAIVLSAAVMGGAIYYLQIYAYYEAVETVAGQDVKLVSRASNTSEPIPYERFEGIDAESSPIRYRACFTTSLTPAEAAQTYVEAKDMAPRIAPDWFACFDAAAIGAQLEAGTAKTFIGAKNIAFGVDRIVAITDDGRGYVWHELNNCGEKAYDGTIVGEECPKP